VPVGVRTAALALVLAGAVGAAGLTGVALAARATPPPATRTISTAAGEKLAFSRSTLRVPAGRVVLRLNNVGDIGHNIAVRGRKLARPRLGKIVQKGKISTVTVTLAAGTYTYFCSVFGHKKGGMKGTLTVKAPQGRPR
jgi:plastocyanin